MCTEIYEVEKKIWTLDYEGKWIPTIKHSPVNIQKCQNP